MDNAPAQPAAKSKPSLPAITGEIPQGIELINYVAECLALGCDPEDIRKQLLAFGHTPANAEKLVADTIAWREKNPTAGKSSAPVSPDAGGLNGMMLLGVGIALLGLAATGIGFISSITDGLLGTAVVAVGVAVVFVGRLKMTRTETPRPTPALESTQPEPKEQGDTGPVEVMMTVEKDSADEKIPDEAYAYALDQLAKGFKPPEIRRSLAQAGYAPREIETIMEHALAFHHREGAASIRGGGNTNVIAGCALIVIGIVITVGTMSMASSGGTYVVAWGAILTGLVWMFRGMNQRPQS